MAYFYSHEKLNESPVGKGGKESVSSELNIFSHVATQSEIESVYWEPIYPNEGSLDSSKKGMTFTVKPSLDMTSLADSYMEVICSLKKISSSGEWSNPSDEEKVFPTNSVMYNLFKGDFL